MNCSRRELKQDALIFSVPKSFRRISCSPGARAFRKSGQLTNVLYIASSKTAIKIPKPSFSRKTPRIIAAIFKHHTRRTAIFIIVVIITILQSHNSFNASAFARTSAVREFINRRRVLGQSDAMKVTRHFRRAPGTVDSCCSVDDDGERNRPRSAAMTSSGTDRFPGPPRNSE